MSEILDIHGEKVTYKYTLIVSQYHNSYHCFIVEFVPETFAEQFRLLAMDLCTHKGEDQKKYINRGTAEFCFVGIRQQYSMPGYLSGLQAHNYTCLHNLQQKLEDYVIHVRKSAYPVPPGDILRQIEKNHNYSKIYDIVNKHFEIL